MKTKQLFLLILFAGGIYTPVHSGKVFDPSKSNEEVYLDFITRFAQPKDLEEGVRRLIKEVDVMMFFETPFDWDIMNYRRDNGVKTALMTMYECTPRTLPTYPDLFLCPSELDMEFFPNHSVFIPVPVDEPWELRTTAKTFVHNSGYIGLKGRSGTQELIDAVQYIESDLRLIIRSQDKKIQQMAESMMKMDGKPRDLEVYAGVLPYENLRVGCDVCIAPEKFNGLSLPLQECRASGMLVITTDRFPANSWLPTEPLIPVRSYSRQRVAGRMIEFQQANVHPKDINGQSLNAPHYPLTAKEIIP